MDNENAVQVESQQLILTRRVYIANMEPIGNMIIERATSALADDGENWYVKNIVGGDGIFEPFHEVSQELSDFCAENGNSDDETEYLASVWINVLLNAPEPARFLDLMRRLSDVQVHGL